MESDTVPLSLVRQTPNRKFSSSISPKDLWLASRNGSLSEIDSALLSLKKNGGNIDSRNAAGLTPLHIAIWRNHVPAVKRLLAAGADPDARDGESGWSSLHRALHFGHLAIASILVQAGSSLTLEDSKCRTPVDLLSGPVSLVVGNKLDSVATEVYSWGSGTNYQLGTGNAHIQKLPGKVEALHDSYIKIIAASKFHSIAVGSSGELYTWGFGRGGRLGQPDFDVHSGQAAVITPRLVTLGLGSRQVKAVAAAKHHTAVATESGEVFTWGSNREGQLGYTSVDTQPTPRRVTCLRARMVAVAAANKHTAAVAESGEVFTWGCNKEGQLGYGTSNSASNYTPRMVECLKGKVFKGVSAAKYHTIVLSAEGEVFTWGHRLVNPRRVSISRNLKKGGPVPLKFHFMERLHVTSIAAGMTHSSALTDDGALFYWSSSDPDLTCHQLYSLCGRNIVSISAGKYWTAAVTTLGDVYMWDGKNCKNGLPVVTRLPGIKRATSVCVGETHLLAVCALYHPAYLSTLDSKHQTSVLKDNKELDDLDEDLLFNDMQPDVSVPVAHNKNEGYKPVPTLKSLCEKVAAEFLVEPRNALQLLEIADSLEAEDLRKHCEDLVIRNLDYIFTVSAPAIGTASLELLAKLEKLLDARSSEPWSYRHLPTPTATFPVIYSEEDGDHENGNPMLRDDKRKFAPKIHGDFMTESFLQRVTEADQNVSKQVRALRKKLQQIEMLQSKQLSGHSLDDQQIAKLQSRSTLEDALAKLGFPVVAEHKMSLPGLSDGKGNGKADNSKKQRRKSKQKVAQLEATTINYEICEEKNSIKGFPHEKSFSKEMDLIEPTSESKMVENYSPISSNINQNSSGKKSLWPNSNKRKNKKGGLSMFLSGALDDSPRNIPPPPSPKCEGPAWGGVKITKDPTSLRDIQNEQSKTKETNIKTKEHQDHLDSIEVASFGQVRLGSYLPKVASIPVAVEPSRGVLAPEEKKNTPTWSSSGSSPILHRPSLRDIQLQQEKKQQHTSHSPKTRTSGFAIPPHGSSSESSDPVPSRWFKPETEFPSSIRSIQIEEKAIKEFKRFYSSVKLVKPQPQPL